MRVERPFSSGLLSVIGVSQRGRPLFGEDVVPVVSIGLARREAPRQRGMEGACDMILPTASAAAAKISVRQIGTDSALADTPDYLTS